VLYVVGGFGLALLAVVAALPLVLSIDPLAYPDIRLVCRALGNTRAQCTVGALEAGLVSAAGLIIATLVALGLRPAERQEILEIPHHIVLPLAIGCVGALLLAAAIAAPSTPFVSREIDITANASLVSIVNLGWPLLLQLSVSSRALSMRLAYLAALVTLLCLSPFRAAFVAVVAFGVMLPIIGMLLQNARVAQTFHARRLLRRGTLAAGAGVLLIGAVLAVVIAMQTAERDLTAMDSGDEPSPVATAEGKLAQRISYPLFQAYYARAVAQVEELPGALDELKAKFRLGSSPSLNHRLFEKIYNRDTVGEMTSLYYGEAAARTSLPPLFWIVAAGLLYVLAWLLFARLGADVAVLAGVAIWRGSLGGAFSVLPAFLIQALIVLAFTRLGARREEPR